MTFTIILIFIHKTSIHINCYEILQVSYFQTAAVHFKTGLSGYIDKLMASPQTEKIAAIWKQLQSLKFHSRPHKHFF